MVDIHSHILWDVDDGVETLEESLELLGDAARAGTTDIVATPHASPDFRFQPELNQILLSQLSDRVQGRPNLHWGCDFHLSRENIEDALEHPRKYTINGLCYLLVEFSDLIIFESSERDLTRLRDTGIIPIITHPERNPLLRQRLGLLAKWVAQGCLIQVTAMSYLGRFGKKAGKFSDTLTREGLVHFVASDAHHPRHRHGQLDEAYAFVCNRYSAELAERLFVTNPRCVLTGEPLSAEPLPVLPVRNWLERVFGR